MENEKKLGQEQAFPMEQHNGNGLYEIHHGMTKRFYAACAAMQGILAGDHKNLQCYMKKDSKYSMNQTFVYDFEKIAKKSFQMADELLKQENL